MTIDEEMKDVFTKVAKASSKGESCKNNAHFSHVFLQSSLAAMEGQNPKNGAKTPSIMHAMEPKMQFLGSKLVCAYHEHCGSHPSVEHNFRKTKD